MRTPLKRSPYNYFQERYRGDPWALLVVVMMLNQTNGKQVEQVHERFFELYPTAVRAMNAHVLEMVEVLRPLGLHNRRARAIMKMSEDFVTKRWMEPTELHGCGKYAQESWDIFIKGELPVSPDDVDDKELKRYVEWARGKASSEHAS